VKKYQTDEIQYLENKTFEKRNVSYKSYKVSTNTSNDTSISMEELSKSSLKC